MADQFLQLCDRFRDELFFQASSTTCRVISSIMPIQLILESVINYRTYSIVSSFPTMKFSILRSDFLFEVVQRYTGVDIIVMDLIYSAGLFMTGYLRD